MKNTPVWYEQQTTPEERKNALKDIIHYRLRSGLPMKAKEFRLSSIEFHELVREVAAEHKLGRWMAQDGAVGGSDVTPS